MGPAAFDAEVPLPVELIKAVCATYKDGDPDILFIVMATDRLEFLQEARPRDGESVMCPVCGIKLAQDEVQNHFNKKGECHTYVVKGLARNGHKLYACRADSACTDPNCINKEPTDPTQYWEPFLNQGARDNHENRHLRSNTHRTRKGLISSGFVEHVRVSVDYVGAPSQKRLPIYDAIGTITKLKYSTITVRFDLPVHGDREHNFTFGFTLTRLSDGEKYYRGLSAFQLYKTKRKIEPAGGGEKKKKKPAPQGAIPKPRGRAPKLPDGSPAAWDPVKGEWIGVTSGYQAWYQAKRAKLAASR